MQTSIAMFLGLVSVEPVADVVELPALSMPGAPPAPEPPSPEPVPLDVCVCVLNASLCADPNTRAESTPRPSSNPRMNSPRKSGNANVVDPSPAPNVVPMTANNAAYAVRETNAPFAFTHPAGATVTGHGLMSPGLNPLACVLKGISIALKN
jgi:hypothetical protein